MENNKNIVLIGYSGHSFVVLEIFRAMGSTVSHYCDVSEKADNPYGLSYLGSENNPIILEQLKAYDHFISIGDNKLRGQAYAQLSKISPPLNAIHPSAIVSETLKKGNGIMIGAGVIINAQSSIGNGVICNTGSIIEHECEIGHFAHIAPGAVLCGNVKVGKNAFIGANAVVKQGVTIGENVIIGAGSVIIKDIPDNQKIAGNPSRSI